MSSTYFELVRAPTDMDEQGTVESQQGLWSIQELRFPHCSDPFTDLIFDVASDLIKFFDFLGRFARRIHPRRELIR